MGEAIRCAESLLIITGNLFIGMEKQKKAALDQLAPGEEGTFTYVHDDGLVARQMEATADWRTVLARRNLDGTEETARALMFFDEMRAAAINDFVACNVDGPAMDRLGLALKGVHLASGVVGAQINSITASDYFAGFERMRLRRLASKELKRAQKNFDDWADATIPTAEGPSD